MGGCEVFIIKNTSFFDDKNITTSHIDFNSIKFQKLFKPG